jgi:glycosyltransferase involved in cell wall biosynthesis
MKASSSSARGTGSDVDTSTSTKDRDTQPERPASTAAFQVMFVHLDWGIGGAEQLMLQLAEASTGLGHNVSLLTSRCDPDHCFAALKPPNGMLYSKLNIRGAWIPAHILGGRCQALCSTLRLLYLAHCVVVETSSSSPDLIVLDVLPTPLLILRWFTASSLLFYCHFPDRLLIRNKQRKKSWSSIVISIIQFLYRFLFNWIEEITMGLADTITVNSKFTRETVLQTFPSLARTKRGQESALPILYPALEVPPLTINESLPRNLHQIVSLNRYERKKNLELLILAAAWIRENDPDIFSSMKIVIAGGYDKKNIENVQYRQELESLAQKLSIVVDFRLSISDAERRDLLATSAAVAYTPSNEHFGIVPLEAMAAETPVVAINNGGPLETVRHGETGLLCEPTPQSFGAALQNILKNPNRAQKMGKAGRQHVLDTFGPERLQREWKQLTERTIQAKNRRRFQASRSVVVYQVLALYCVEMLLLFFICGCIFWVTKASIGITTVVIQSFQNAVVHHDEI